MFIQSFNYVQLEDDVLFDKKGEAFKLSINETTKDELVKEHVDNCFHIPAFNDGEINLNLDYAGDLDYNDVFTYNYMMKYCINDHIFNNELKRLFKIKEIRNNDSLIDFFLCDKQYSIFYGKERITPVYNALTDLHKNDEKLIKNFTFMEIFSAFRHASYSGLLIFKKCG